MKLRNIITLKEIIAPVNIALMVGFGLLFFLFCVFAPLNILRSPLSLLVAALAWETGVGIGSTVYVIGEYIRHQGSRESAAQTGQRAARIHILLSLALVVVYTILVVSLLIQGKV